MVVLLKVVNHHNLYSNSNRLKNLSATYNDASLNYLYDDLGRTTSDVTKHATYRYDYRGMIDSIFCTHPSGDLINRTDTLIYAYNGNNQRVMKVHNYWYMGDCVGQDPPGEDMIIGDDGGGQLDGEGGGGNPIQCPRQGIVATFYVWSGNEIVAEYDIRDSLRYQYVYASGRRVATITCVDNGYRGKVFHHYDALGSMRRSTAGSGPDQGIISQELEYDAWGRNRVQSSTTPEFTFTGQQWDDDLGINLFYLRNRYYDPKIGRFTTPDLLVSDLNPYSYANNNPVMLVDPSGLSGIHFETTVWRSGSMIDPARYRSMWGARNNYLGTAGSSGPDIIEGSSGSRQGATDQYGNPLFDNGGSLGGFGLGFTLRLATLPGAIGSMLVGWERNMIYLNVGRAILRQLELKTSQVKEDLAKRLEKMKSKLTEAEYQFYKGLIENVEIAKGIKVETKSGSLTAVSALNIYASGKTIIVLNTNESAATVFAGFMKEGAHVAMLRSNSEAVGALMKRFNQGDDWRSMSGPELYCCYGPIAWNFYDYILGQDISFSRNEERWATLDRSGGSVCFSIGCP